LSKGSATNRLQLAVDTKNKQGQKRTLAATVAFSPSVDAKSVLERSAGAKPPFEEPVGEKPADKVVEKTTPDKEASAKERIDTSDTAEAPLPEIRKSSGPGAVPYVLAPWGSPASGRAAFCFIGAEKTTRF